MNMFKYMIIMAGILGQVCGSGVDSDGKVPEVPEFKVGRDIDVSAAIKALKSTKQIKLEHIVKNNGQEYKSGCDITLSISENTMSFDSIVLGTFADSFGERVSDFIVKYSNNQYAQALDIIHKLVQKIQEVDQEHEKSILVQQAKLTNLKTTQPLPAIIQNILKLLLGRNFLQDTSWERDLSIIEEELEKHKIYEEINQFWNKKKEGTFQSTEQKKAAQIQLQAKLKDMQFNQLKFLQKILGYINSTTTYKSFLDWQPGQTGTKEQIEEWNGWSTSFNKVVSEHEKQKTINPILTTAQTILKTRKALRQSIRFLEGILDYLNTFSPILNKARRVFRGVNIEPQISKIQNNITEYIKTYTNKTTP